MKNEMLLSLKRRFSDIESNPPLVIACLLDPRFKDRFLSGVIQQAEAKRILLEELENLDQDDARSFEPPSKRSNTESTKI